jgi:hemolysin D
MGQFWSAVKSGIAHEKQNKRQPLNRNEREFQAASIEILETPASPSVRVFSIAIMTFAVIAGFWSWYGRIDTTATLQGKIVPVGKIKVVEPLAAGTIRSINVKVGDEVKMGDELIELDPTEHAAERNKLAAELELAKLAALRLRATLDAVDNQTLAVFATFKLPKDINIITGELQQLQMRQSLAAFQAEQNSLSAEIAQKKTEIDRSTTTLVERRKLVSLTGDRTQIFTDLQKRGFGAKTKTIDARQSEQDQTMTLVSEEGHIAELDAAGHTLDAKRIERKEAFLDKTVTELVDTERRVQGLTQELLKAEFLDRSSLLKSPATGRVQQLLVTTVGQVVTAGQQLMVIVPNGTPLEIEAMLLNKDKGFVREGQQARIKLDAFPFTKYGTLDGKVATVSNDAIPAGSSQTSKLGDSTKDGTGALVFPVRISMGTQSIAVAAENVQLTPGMSVQVEVKTGDRRVIEFLFDPLIKVANESFHER